MNMARVMEDGHLLMPPEVAEMLRVRPGDSVGVEVDADGTVRLQPKVLGIDEVCGMLRPPTGTSLTIEQMEEAVAESFRRGES